MISKVKKRVGKRRWIEIGFVAAMLAFTVVYTLIFYFGVNIKSWLNAFQIKSRGEISWSLINFEMFFNDLKSPISEIGIMLKNGLVMFVCTNLIQLPLCIVCSYVFFRKILGAKFFRVMFYFPSIISMVSLTLIFYYFIDAKGLLSLVYNFFGMKMPAFLGSDDTAYNTIMFFSIFTGMGYTIILISGVMSRLPTEIFESARVDGCPMWRELVQIVTPLIWPTVSTLFILHVTSSFMYFGPVMMLTNGQYNTMTVGLYVFNKTQTGVYNYPAAVGLMFSACILPVVFALKWFFGKISEGVEF